MTVSFAWELIGDFELANATFALFVREISSGNVIQIVADLLKALLALTRKV